MDASRRKHRIDRARGTGAAAAYGLLLAICLSGPQAAAQSLLPDFNGDGFNDLALGVPGEDGLFTDAGAVQVLYGTATGLSAAGDQLWTQDSPDIADDVEQGDQFGSALTHGDFNGDGFSDLAIGTPFEDLGAIVDAGAVNVLYGTAGGLVGAGSQLWHQDSRGIADLPADGDRFGHAVGAGDFNGDGFDDLAVGVVGDLIKVQATLADNAGSVHVIYGSAAGLTRTAAQWWTQKTLADSPKEDDFFGWALASGDLNRDGFDELIIGAPFEDTARPNTGVVFVLTGGSGGLVPGTIKQQVYIQGHKDLPDLDCPFQPFPAGCQEAEDQFGSAVSSGDYNGDGFDDLAIGVPNEDLGGVVNMGQVHVLYGSRNGPVRVGSDIWNQDQPDVADQAERNDRYGSALTTGDVDGDGFDDLVIGAPGETLDDSIATKTAGAVFLLLGSSARLTVTGQQSWSQDAGTMEDSAEPGDGFGRTLASADFDGDGRSDLAVGVPGEDLAGPLGEQVDAGAVNVLYGYLDGLSDARNQLWHQDAPEVEEDTEAGDAFGAALAR